MTTTVLHAVDAPAPFHVAGRGPILARWLHDRDLHLPDSEAGYQPFSGDIQGAVTSEDEAGDAWVVFHGLQVIQIVPYDLFRWSSFEAGTPAGSVDGTPHVYRVENSPWLERFGNQHLADAEHFVLEFYDDVAEVLCRELIFGQGSFDIARVLVDEPRLGYAHLRRGLSLRNQGRLEEALAELENYIACAPHVPDVEFGRVHAEGVRAILRLEPALASGGGATAIRQLVTELGWTGVRSALWEVLDDDTASAHWHACAEAFLEAVREGRDVGSAVALVGLLYFRFDPDGTNRHPLVVELTGRLLDLDEGAPFDPRAHRGVAYQLELLSRKRGDA